MSSSMNRMIVIGCLLALILSIILSGPVGVVDARKLVQSSRDARSGKVRRRRPPPSPPQHRHLQKNNNQQGGAGGNKNNNNMNAVGGGGGGKNNGKDQQQPLAFPTQPPNTPYPITPYPTTTAPTLPPSNPPSPAVTTSEQVKPAEDVFNTTPEEEQQQTQTTSTSNNNNQVSSLTLEELQNIQYFGGGQITLRFSLWFQDETSSTASQVGSGSTLLAVLQSLQELLCRSDEEPSLGLATLEWSTPVSNNQNQNENQNQQQVEERELCVVPLELGGAEMRNSNGNVNAMEQGSILLQPPTTYVVDRTGSNTNLHWTTWRVTWDVLRLGTFYILQGLENMGANDNNDDGDKQEDVVAIWGEEEIYRAGINAMQGILELALEVSIRESSLDKSLVGSMVQTSQSHNGMVLSSVYGEEVETLEPKLEWLGLATSHSGPTSNNNGNDNLVLPTSSTLGNSPQGDNNAASEEATTSTTSDADGQVSGGAGAAEDDEWDDDRYSQTYGITEPLDPEFWHPLRIVGIIMFLLTTACLVGLSTMSKRRQKRRELERKEAKEGLLNNPQCVEDMLTASSKFEGDKKAATTTTASASAATRDNNNNNNGESSSPSSNSKRKKPRHELS